MEKVVGVGIIDAMANSLGRATFRKWKFGAGAPHGLGKRGYGEYMNQKETE